jgi:hypothetical protein
MIRKSGLGEKAGDAGERAEQRERADAAEPRRPVPVAWPDRWPLDTHGSAAENRHDHADKGCRDQDSS